MINIAIAEDNIEHQNLLKTYVSQNNNFNLLHVADNGAKMVQWLSTTSQKPDVIIADYQMQPMDGLQLTCYLDFFEPNIKVLAISGHDHLYPIENMFANGAKGYKGKSFLSKFARNRSDFSDFLKMFYNSIETVASNDYYLDETFSWNENFCFSFAKYNPYQLWQQQMQVIKTSIAALNITQQEYKVLFLSCTGCSKESISKMLFIEEKTVDNHVQKIHNKLDVHNSRDLVSQAYRYQLVPCAKLEPLFKNGGGVNSIDKIAA